MQLLVRQQLEPQAKTEVLSVRGNFRARVEFPGRAMRPDYLPK